MPVHASFAAIRKAAAIMERFDRPWYIAGGWAIDLFLERVTRPHGDVDVAILRGDQRALYEYLRTWEIGWAMPRRAGRLEPWRGEWLDPPVHELHARRDRGDPQQLEFLLNESHGNLWQYRRDLRITRPLHEVGLQTKSGVPVLAPEIVLLFKAKRPTAQDRLDFKRTRPGLEPERRAWLRGALATCHPRHPWIEHL